MDIREFLFRHLQEEETETTKELRNSEIKNDPECREMCGRFLWSEILHQGYPDGFCYDPDVWEPMAEYLINNILPSDDFMHDCISFFADIREGKGEKYVS